MLQRCAFDDCDFCVRQRIMGDRYVCYGGVDLDGFAIPSCIHCTTRLPPYTQVESSCDFEFNVGEEWIEPALHMDYMSAWNLTPFDMWGGQDPYECQHFHDLRDPELWRDHPRNESYYSAEDLWGQGAQPVTPSNTMQCSEEFDNIHISSPHEHVLVQYPDCSTPVRARRYHPFHPYRKFSTP